MLVEVVKWLLLVLGKKPSKLPCNEFLPLIYSGYRNFETIREDGNYQGFVYLIIGYVGALPMLIYYALFSIQEVFPDVPQHKAGNLLR